MGKASGRKAVASGATAIILVLLALLPATTLGHHSITDPPRFWDDDNDSVGELEDARVEFEYGGSQWGPDKRDGVLDSLAAWRNHSDYKPKNAIEESGYWIFVDGTLPQAPCANDFDGALQGTCNQSVLKNVGQPNEYRDIIYTAVYTNSDEYTWDWDDSGYTPGSQQFSWRGILTHELGHTGGLTHHPVESTCSSTSTTRPTMCPGFNQQNSYYAATINADDADSMDDIYIP